MRYVTTSPLAGRDCHVAHADAAVAAIAARQHGLVTTAQLMAAGLGRGAIEHRVRTGRLRRWCRGVYLAAPAPLPWTPEMAALLACGVERSALSHWTAAARYGLAPKPDTVHIIVTGNVRSRPGVRVHRTTHLETTTHHGLRVTTPTRTLDDLAKIATATELERLANEARIQGLTLLPSRSSPALRRALTATPTITRSEAERRLVDLIARAGLPKPQTNVRIHGHEVDALWPAERLVVEVDGYAFHASRAAFERDRARDARLTAAGHRVIRITWRQLAGEPERVAATIAGALARAA
jgi:very-short-patch-repair endonuclease